jgi:predicted dehydrogenase
MKIGVIGLGLGVSFVEALNESKFVENIVICDTHEDRLALISSKYPKVSAQYQDLNQMLENEKPEAVCVVTPDHFHRMHAEICIEAGCHILLTKPVATNLDDAKSIILTADKYQRKLMVAQERRMNANFLEIKQYLDDGVLGDIIQIRYDCIQDKRQQFATSPWFASPEAGRSALIGSGIHCVDVVSHLVQRPVVKVSAFSNRLGGLVFSKDKTMAAIFQFEGQAVGEVSVTYEAHSRSLKPGENIFHIVGTKGLATFDRIISDEWDDWKTLPKDESPIEESIKRLVFSFVDSLVHDKPVLISGREAFKALAYCVAADEAAQNGQITKPHPINF